MHLLQPKRQLFECALAKVDFSEPFIYIVWGMVHTHAGLYQHTIILSTVGWRKHADKQGRGRSVLEVVWGGAGESER